MTLLKSSFVPKYDPFEEYFESLPPWDDSMPDYIKTLSNYVQVKERKWFDLQFKKMLVRMVALSLGKTPFNKHCFTIKSGQNDGKTTFLRFLCPPKLNNYIAEQIDIHDKDGKLALCQNFIINLDELSQFAKQDINKTKALFTLAQYKARLPYDKKPSVHKRRASFLATTNDDQFLVDETGSIRWLVFEIEGINHDKGGINGYNQNINIDLVYSQAYSLLKKGFDYQLTKEEIRKSENNNNNKHQIRTFEQELIQTVFRPSNSEEDGSEFLTSSEIKIRLDKLTKHNTSVMKIGKAMKKLGFIRSQKRVKVGLYPVWGYHIFSITE